MRARRVGVAMGATHREDLGRGFHAAATATAFASVFLMGLVALAMVLTAIVASTCGIVRAMRTQQVMIAMCSAALAFGACKTKDEAPATGSARAGSGSGSATASASGSGAASGSGGARVELLTVDEAGAKKLVDAWLAAQNSGDFAAYEALYAPKLEGIKRVGARSWRFDRAGWLADRKRMFKHPMTVGAKDIAVRGSSIAATVDLVQTFSQGKFKDEGPKHLVLVKEWSGVAFSLVTDWRVP
ncbi:MAG: hypothetical protein HY908_33135 [Myxococcales bacterium]|nr:hypothetical protein [Myxococcales bacterium]